MTSISLNPASLPDAAPTNPGSSAAASPRPQPALPGSGAPHDTVKLSQGAQVVTLHRSGQSTSSIAAALGIAKSAVNDYLGIIETTAIQVSAGGGGGGGGASASTSSTAASGTTAATSTSATPSSDAAASDATQTAATPTVSLSA